MLAEVSNSGAVAYRLWMETDDSGRGASPRDSCSAIFVARFGVKLSVARCTLLSLDANFANCGWKVSTVPKVGDP